jgi:hypothetical protein
VSYAFHGRPPEGDCKPPQAADFVALGFLAGLDHFAGRVDGAEHHGGLAELLDLIAKVRCNPRSFASAECGRNATRLNEAGFCPSAGSGHGRGSKSASFHYRE